MKNLSILFFLIFNLLLSGYTIAQNIDLRAYTQEDGLPQSQVYDVIQDNMGYLWLGTQGGGISRFDGKSFKTWTTSDGLNSNYIFSLLQVHDRLFIGTQQGLSIKTNDQFLNIEGPQINHIFHFGNHCFFGTNTGIYTLDDNNRSLKKINLTRAIDLNQINSIAFDGNYFWIASTSGLWQVNKLDNKPHLVKRYDNNKFTSLIYHKNKLFASSFNHGILVIDTKSSISEDQVIEEPLRINNIALLNDNEIWISTDQEGITVLDAQNFNKIKLINNDNGLKVAHIRKCMVDRQSNIWIATSGGGLYKYDTDNNFTHFDKETGLNGNRIYALHVTHDAIWASNSEAGLVKIDSLGIHSIPQHKAILNTKIKTISSDSSGNIWAGTDGRGLLYRVSTRKDSIIIDTNGVNEIKLDTIPNSIVTNHILNTSNGFPFNWIRKVHVVNDGIWVASYSSGIIKFNYNTDTQISTILESYDRKNGIKDLYIRDIKDDSQGRLWYATKKGHLGFIYNKKVIHLGKVLPTSVAIGTILFHNDKMYLGTAGKGVWWASISDRPVFKKLIGDKQLYSENINQLIFDKQNNLWVGTEQGVDKVLLDENAFIKDVFHFGSNNGFLGLETCLNAIILDNKNNLWFGAIHGLTKYKATISSKTTLKPKLYFEAVNVAYRTIDSLPLHHWVNSNKVLQLNPNQTQLGFNYTSVDIDHPTDILYRFKLNDDTWSPWSSKKESSFSGLAYGNHIFTAQSRNHRWEESDPVSFQFYIDAPIYKKPWFLWLLFGTALLILTGIALMYISRLRLKNEEESKKLELKNHLLSLEHKALQLQMNPHFIFNVLNGIKAMASSDLHKLNITINTFATLLRDTLSNSRKESISLEQELKTLERYIKLEQLMSLKEFSYSLKLDSDLDAEEILIPPMLIQPFVENAIRHGILKTIKKGILDIKFETDNDFLHCHITDNGIGIYQSQNNKPKTDHQSMALKITEERLASITGKDTLVITEINTEKSNETGTKITFKIPLITDY